MQRLGRLAAKGESLRSIPKTYELKYSKEAFKGLNSRFDNNSSESPTTYWPDKLIAFGMVSWLEIPFYNGTYELNLPLNNAPVVLVMWALMLLT